MPQEAAKEAGGMGRLRLKLLRLLRPQLVELCRGLLQGILLHQNSLRQDIKRIRIAAKPLVQQLLGLGIFLGELGLLDTTDQVVQHGFFLGSHLVSNGR